MCNSKTDKKYRCIQKLQSPTINTSAKYIIFSLLKKIKYIKIGINKNLKNIIESWKELILLYENRLINIKLNHNNIEILKKLILFIFL